MIHLSHEHTREFRDVLREFCRAEVLPGAAERDATATYPAALVDRLAELGVLGITVPEEHGGLGLEMVTQVMAIEEVSYADASLGSVLAGHYLGMESIRAFGTEEQQARYLPGVADGSRRFAFALTEPDAGSDISAIRTTAARDGSRWMLSGRKTFISSARESRGIISFAKTDMDAGIRGITAFIVDSDAPGLGYSAPIGKLGLRGEHAYEIALDGVVVDGDSVLGELGGGGRIALETLNSARIDVAAIATGVGLRALDLAVRYASERVQFGAPIRELQAVQAMLADIDAWVQSGRLHAYNAAAARDRGEDVRRLGAIAKYVATENCFKAADAALQVHGGFGVTTESEIERLYRDSRILRIYEGTSQIQQLTIARLLARRFDTAGSVRD